MEGLEEGGAQDQVCDPSTVDQLCTSLQVGGGRPGQGVCARQLFVKHQGSGAGIPLSTLVLLSLLNLVPDRLPARACLCDPYTRLQEYCLHDRGHSCSHKAWMACFACATCRQQLPAWM
jgi:hypothetical protein